MPIGQTRRLVLGHRHHADQRQDHNAEADQVPVEEADLFAAPVEMPLGDAARGEDAMGGVEQQPDLGHFQQGAAEGGVLAAGVQQQGQPGDGEGQGAGQGEEDGDQDRQRGMQLAVALEVADVVVQLRQLVVQVAAFPQQRGDQQEQRQEQQRPIDQAFAQFTHPGAPGDLGELVLQQGRGHLEPGQVERLVAGNPEHLLVEGGAQALAGGKQLFLVQLQGDRFVEQRVEFVVEPFEQLGTGCQQGVEILAQFRRDLLAGLLGEQVVQVLLRGRQLVAFLVQFELAEAQVGDLVGQALVGLDLGQRLFLLVEDARQQQAAAQDVDLFLEGLVGLGQVVQLLLGLEVAPGEHVEAVGGTQEVVGETQVLGVLLAQQAVGAGPLGAFLGQLGDGLFRLLAALLADQRLQVEGFLFQARDLLGEQIVLALAEVLQQVVAGQLLAQQLALHGQCGLLGEQLAATVGVDRLAAFLAGLEQRADFQDPCLHAADAGLGSFRTGLGGDRQAVGLAQGFLPLGLLGGAVVEQHFQAGRALAAVAFADRTFFGLLQALQFALVFLDLPGRVAQALFQVLQALQRFVARGEELEGLFEAGLGDLLVGFGELAFGQLVEALLDGFGRGRLGLGEERRTGKAEAEEKCSDQGAEGRHGREETRRRVNAG